ncbi:MAG: hypothetical protein WC816_10680 [Sphingomonas sp.]
MKGGFQVSVGGSPVIDLKDRHVLPGVIAVGARLSRHNDERTLVECARLIA